MDLNNDMLGIEPPSPVAEWRLEERAFAAATFWGAVGAEVDRSIIRDFGMSARCDYNTAVLASHQRRFFLPGLAKLGIPETEPDAVKCARYHGCSNALGGVNTRYSIESPKKAWVFYHPYTMGSGMALFPDEGMLSTFRGWHVHNGDSLGNPGLVFVVTHLHSRGDPFDAGYFLDTGESLPASERLRIAFGEPAPAEEARRYPEVDDDAWPEERRIKALRNFSVEWAWDIIATAVEHFGAEALGSVRHGCETAAFSFLPYYRQAVGGDGVQAAAGYFSAVHEIGGWDVATSERAGSTTVAFDRDPVRGVVGDRANDWVAGIYGAVADGWAGAAGVLGAELSFALDDGDAPTWTFSAKRFA